MTQVLEPTRRPAGKSKLAVILVVLVVTAVVALACGAAVWLIGRSSGETADFSGPGTGTVVVEVVAGDTAADIGSTLVAADVVASTAAFVDAAVADDRSLGIQPGFYKMKQQMSAEQALALLLDPASRVETEVAIPEGLRIDQIIDRLVDATGLPRSEFETLIANPRAIGLPSFAKGNPEGFLFPATYTFGPQATAEEVLTAMVDRFDVAAHDLRLKQRAAAVGLTPYEVVIVGSLVQAEVAVRDFGKASRVVFNRLELGMPLGFDSTVNFALESDDLTLTDEQLAVDSPYNTYDNVGLPPGPINSPGEAALEAALDPPPGDWLYFIAVAPDSDETRFTNSYEEFLQFKDEFYAQDP